MCLNHSCLEQPFYWVETLHNDQKRFTTPKSNAEVIKVCKSFATDGSNINTEWALCVCINWRSDRKNDCTHRGNLSCRSAGAYTANCYGPQIIPLCDVEVQLCKEKSTFSDHCFKYTFESQPSPIMLLHKVLVVQCLPMHSAIHAFLVLNSSYSLAHYTSF